MEGTSMDNDPGPSHALPATMTFPLSSSAVSGQTQQTLELSQPQKSEGQSTQAPKFSNGPHIRSRITVVCAECKRLKLKCDRRTPCSSCLKRDTTARCVYSQAAVEKIDVQSLHNRLLVLESAFNHLSSVSPTTPISAALAGLPEIKTRISVSGSSGQSSNTASQTHSLAGLPCSDRALLAIGASGSSVVISLEDVASIWLGELDDPAADTDSKAARTDTSPTRPSASGGIKVKLEPTSVLIPPVSSSSSVASSFNIGTVPPSFSPPISYDAFLPPSAFYSAPPEVTPELVLKNMPLAPRRARYLAAMRETMLLHPCFNVPHFMQRVDAMINWAESGPRSVPASGSRSFANGAGSKSKEELARELFLGPSGKSGSSRKETARPQPPAHSKPTLSFFAAACAACALGAMAAREEVVASDDSLEPGINPAALFSLSEQSLGLFEKTATYDLDSVIAMILQVLYLLHDGKMSVAQGVFPLIGKMINVARMMGLSMDPDEFPGTYSLFEAETRRRVWWDVFYYDLFISDCMGHPPLIADNSFTTRFPADVDEHLFTPSSTSLPYTSQGADWSETSTAYFVLKCRLAQLVKNVKKQTFKDPLGDDSADLSVDLAATFETEVSSFLQDLPPPFRLEMDQDISTIVPSPSCSPFLLAQRCELAILANRLILKLYLPFLKDTTGGTQPNRPSHQAVLGTINAAHLVIYASRLLHAVWRHTRPAAFDFYDFGRTLFDAAVVCAHAVIQQPTSILAAEAMKCVGCALDIMKELGAVRTGVEGMRGDNNRAEAIKVVEMMKRKAEAARSGPVSAGAKRKHADIESETLSPGFQLPFVGASVTSSKTELSKPVGSSSKASTTLSKDVDVVAISKPEPKKLATKEKEKSKEKARYPAVGIRVRPAQMATPTSRQRTGSVSVAATPVTPVSSARTVPLPPPTPCTVSIPVSSSLGQPDTPRTAISASPSVPPSVSTYDSMQPQDAYPMRYPASDDLLGERRFSSHSTPSYDSPQSVMYEQSARYHSAQQSPASYTAPGPPDYYMSYASSSGPSPTYENPGLVPSQNLSMMPSAPAMETVGAPPMTGLCHDPYATHDKSHNSYPSHISEPRQMTQDYQPPPTGHPMSMSTPHIQGWPQTDPGSTGDMQWTDYKFFDGMTG